MSIIDWGTDKDGNTVNDDFSVGEAYAEQHPELEPFGDDGFQGYDDDGGDVCDFVGHDWILSGPNAGKCARCGAYAEEDDQL